MRRSIPSDAIALINSRALLVLRYRICFTNANALSSGVNPKIDLTSSTETVFPLYVTSCSRMFSASRKLPDAALEIVLSASFSI